VREVAEKHKSRGWGTYRRAIIDDKGRDGEIYNPFGQFFQPALPAQSSRQLMKLIVARVLHHFVWEEQPGHVPSDNIQDMSAVTV